MNKHNRITLRRPSPSEAEAASAPSVETEFVELRKPLYDFLFAQLRDDALVSQYVSDKIAAELVRLSKMKDGGGWKNRTAAHQSSASSARWSQWRETHNRTKGDGNRHTVRVRVFDKAHKAFLALSENRVARVAKSALVVQDALAGIDGRALAEYCKSHKEKPPKFITLPDAVVAEAKVIARDFDVPFSKIISFIFENT